MAQVLRELLYNGDLSAGASCCCPTAGLPIAAWALAASLCLVLLRQFCNGPLTKAVGF